MEIKIKINQKKKKNQLERSTDTSKLRTPLSYKKSTREIIKKKKKKKKE